MREIGRSVIRQVKEGNYLAFQKLVEHYHQSVYQISYIIIGEERGAEDLAKDVFLHVFDHIGDSQTTDKKFSLWLFQKTVNIARNQLSQCDRAVVAECPAFNGINKKDIPLMNVTLKERVALTLKSSNCLSVNEISDVLDIPSSDTKTRIWRGREMIREIFGNRL